MFASPAVLAVGDSCPAAAFIEFVAPVIIAILWVSQACTYGLAVVRDYPEVADCRLSGQFSYTRVARLGRQLLLKGTFNELYVF